MGACISVHKDPDSDMKFRLSFGSKTDELVIPPPVKDKPVIVNGDRPIAGAGLKSQWSWSHPVTTVGDFGSKEETFFDSQPWLESDTEDFFSVNGDFMPSCGSTPVHQSFSAGTPEAHFDDKSPGSQPEPSPKKKLIELFRESLSSGQDVDEQNISSNQNVVDGKIEAKTTVLGLPPRSAASTPFVSGADSACSGGRTPDGDYRSKKEKPIKAGQCCLPRMLSTRSVSERRKRMSPARSIGAIC